MDAVQRTELAVVSFVFANVFAYVFASMFYLSCAGVRSSLHESWDSMKCRRLPTSHSSDQEV